MGSLMKTEQQLAVYRDTVRDNKGRPPLSAETNFVIEFEQHRVAGWRVVSVTPSNGTLVVLYERQIDGSSEL